MYYSLPNTIFETCARLIYFDLQKCAVAPIRLRGIRRLDGLTTPIAFFLTIFGVTRKIVGVPGWYCQYACIHFDQHCKKLIRLRHALAPKIYYINNSYGWFRSKNNNCWAHDVIWNETVAKVMVALPTTTNNDHIIVLIMILLLWVISLMANTFR